MSAESRKTPSAFAPEHVHEEDSEDEIEVLRAQNAKLMRRLRMQLPADDSADGAATGRRATWKTNSLQTM
jgi:hypothetical protein